MSGFSIRLARFADAFAALFLRYSFINHSNAADAVKLCVVVVICNNIVVYYKFIQV